MKISIERHERENKKKQGIDIYRSIRRQFRDRVHVDLHANIHADMELYDIITLCLFMASYDPIYWFMSTCNQVYVASMWTSMWSSM